MTKAKIATKFHPGEFVREEMEYRGWNVQFLAKRSGLKEWKLTQILDCQFRITQVIAVALSQAFGNSPEMWLNLQRIYDD